MRSGWIVFLAGLPLAFLAGAMIEARVLRDLVIGALLIWYVSTQMDIFDGAFSWTGLLKGAAFAVLMTFVARFGAHWAGIA